MHASNELPPAFDQACHVGLADSLPVKEITLHVDEQQRGVREVEG